jgi:hypothetical protein
MTSIQNPVVSGFPENIRSRDGLGPVGSAALKAGVRLIQFADYARERRERRREARGRKRSSQAVLIERLGEQERDRAFRHGASLYRGLQ